MRLLSTCLLERTDDKNTFVGHRSLGNISGTVKEDTNNDDSGDVPLVGVLITLLDSNGVTLRTTLTDTTGLLRVFRCQGWIILRCRDERERYIHRRV